ncbi:DUF732 domain-containing protein [Nocardiopsis ansamitocini]|uniref:DUF732 domain-containing protein n=1 Tax=Nocardiopsis ansamitocini TaxID=1670832 RepID=A0A9W6UIL7_9ACTN|nr:DUF732 domain-containing protein [Nocardiopsis ansamitocini]GLU47180.1 hypothetical protein Nans01_15310 [Nocardiopsis ansamitocini]
MRIPHQLACAAVAVLLGTACGAGEGEQLIPPATPAPTATATLTLTPSASPGTSTGLPEEPGPKTRAEYLDSLNGIDPALTSPDDDTAVLRGRQTCQMIAETEGREDRDEVRGVEVRELFAVSGYEADGADAELIMAAVRKHLCPDM